jgi:hypothetical protein
VADCKAQNPNFGQRNAMPSLRPDGAPWLWTLASGHHEDRTPTHRYVATREVAMAAFARVIAISSIGPSRQRFAAVPR